VPADWERFLLWLWSEEPSAAPADPGDPPAADAPTETGPEAHPDKADPSAIEPHAAPSDERGDVPQGPCISAEKPGHPSRTPLGSMAAPSGSVSESATQPPTGPRIQTTLLAIPIGVRPAYPHNRPWSHPFRRACEHGRWKAHAVAGNHDEEASALTATYCGRHFTDRILELARTAATRSALSRAVCAEFGWLKPDGGLKDMSCRVALLRMYRDGLITLPEPQHAYARPATIPSRPTPPGPPLSGSRGDLSRLTLDLIRDPVASRRWNDLVAQYHYLGFYTLPGAQLRYFIHGDGILLRVLGFGAAAWKTAPRNNFIGWTPDQRKARLHLVVNNARFLVLPWISVRYLASSVLALAARQLPADWAARYGYLPLLLESFVDRARFAGTS